MSQMKNRDSNKSRREQRQFEAKVRQDLAAARPPAEQLARLDAAHLEAWRERTALQKRMDGSKPAEKAQPAALAAPQGAPKSKKARKAQGGAANAS